MSCGEVSEGIALSCVIYDGHLSLFVLRSVAVTQTPCIPMLDESIQTSLNITYILFHSSIDRTCRSLYKCRQHLYFKIVRWFLSYTILLPLLLLFNFKYWNIGNVITIRLFPKVDIGGFLSFLTRSLSPSHARSLACSQSPPHCFFPRVRVEMIPRR